MVCDLFTTPNDLTGPTLQVYLMVWYKFVVQFSSTGPPVPLSVYRDILCQLKKGTNWVTRNCFIKVLVTVIHNPIRQICCTSCLSRRMTWTEWYLSSGKHVSDSGYEILLLLEFFLSRPSLLSHWCFSIHGIVRLPEFLLWQRDPTLRPHPWCVFRNWQ